MTNDDRDDRLATRASSGTTTTSHHTLAPADGIIVLGSHDTRVAERGAEVFLAGWAPLIVFSGNLGALTSDIWTRPEAEIFAEVAEAKGVPRDRMLLEPRATHTGENVSFSRELLRRAGDPPAAGRSPSRSPTWSGARWPRSSQRWPEVEVIVTSPQISTSTTIPATTITPRRRHPHHARATCSGSTVYAEKGWSARQDIPAEVQAAFERLVKAGYTRRLLPTG